jgi:hypothetical protein
MAMPVFFALSDKKIASVKNGTYLCPGTYFKTIEKILSLKFTRLINSWYLYVVFTIFFPGGAANSFITVHSLDEFSLFVEKL